ncbi:hypothetical protein BDK51DRAFT_33209 [Blyttiomyces helicus]|uniref:Uncharacterized protein n=1 Tax=Blyttiomyces helicus TaxID=388810 RepID=A0A4P9WNF3_9FUNG|nr:hypothetical protein BDK51DRAFT_33209 [Blyttiomyces helicus]|eukprot:RKO92730.1 hypothetical protein BDK51DRAFT_33209 [Blyttiomyces helicus]
MCEQPPIRNSGMYAHRTCLPVGDDGSFRSWSRLERDLGERGGVGGSSPNLTAQRPLSHNQVLGRRHISLSSDQPLPLFDEGFAQPFEGGILGGNGFDGVVLGQQLLEVEFGGEVADDARVDVLRGAVNDAPRRDVPVCLEHHGDVRGFLAGVVRAAGDLDLDGGEGGFAGCGYVEGGLDVANQGRSVICRIGGFVCKAATTASLYEFIIVDVAASSRASDSGSVMVRPLDFDSVDGVHELGVLRERHLLLFEVGLDPAPRLLSRDVDDILSKAGNLVLEAWDTRRGLLRVRFGSPVHPPLDELRDQALEDSGVEEPGKLATMRSRCGRTFWSIAM